MPWFEGDFCGSFNVRKMKPLARLMYRALLAQGWHSDRPPYLPNNEEDLALMADTPSPEAWAEHRDSILQRFKRTDDGQWLYHPKLLREYDRALTEHLRKVQGGRGRWRDAVQEHSSSSASGQFKESTSSHNHNHNHNQPTTAVVAPPPASPTKAPSRGTRIPDNFEPTGEHRSLARELGVDVEDQLARFKDHFRAQPGQRGVKTDWDATFRNWLRRAAEMGNGNGRPPAPAAARPQIGQKKSADEYKHAERKESERFLTWIEGAKARGFTGVGESAWERLMARVKERDRKAFERLSAVRPGAIIDNTLVVISTDADAEFTLGERGIRVLSEMATMPVRVEVV